MPIVRISQRTKNDCLPCCIAMVLDRPLEVVMSWFESREHNDIRIAAEVLDTKGYSLDEVENVGSVGGMRRIVSFVKPGEPEGHAVVMDDDESIVDPQSTATTKKYMPDYWGSTYRVDRVFVIRTKD